MNEIIDIAKSTRYSSWLAILVLAIILYPIAPLAAQEPLSTKKPSYNIPVSVPKAPAVGNTSSAMSLLDPSGIAEALSSISLTQWGIVAAIAGSATIVTAGLKRGGDSWPKKYTTSISSFETVEYKNEWGLGAMKASTFYAQGYAGAGVPVSIIDSGIRTTHQEFAGMTITGLETASATAQGGNGTLDDPDGHGTHVAGTMFARKDGTEIHGVAYDVTHVYVLEGGCPTGCPSLYWTAAELSAAHTAALAMGSRVQNNSWGSTTKLHALTTQAQYAANNGAEYTAWLNAAANGMVQVWATGNDGDLQPSYRSGAAYYIPELKNMWIAVGNVDSNLEEAWDNNRCGDAWESCVVAPGDAIRSSYNRNDTDYFVARGTSMAAPHVSGMVAALMSRFPGLTSKEIVQRVFGTATYTGLKEYSTGTSRLATEMHEDERRRIFGRGLVQMVEAGKPVGGLSVVTGGTVKGLAVPLNLSNISLGTAFGDGLQKNLHDVRLAVFDNYQRATFWVDVSELLQSNAAPLSLSEGLATLAPQIQQQNMPIKNLGTLQVTSLTNAAATFSRNNTSFENIQSLSLRTQFRSNSVEVRYDTTRALSGLGLTTFNTHASLLPNETILVPYAAFARNGLNLALSSDGPGSSRFTFATAYGKGLGLQQSSLLTVAALHSAPSPALNLASHVGLLLEPDTFLGSLPQGAFQLAPNTPTYFLGNAVSYQIYDRYLLEATSSLGVSRPQTTPGSLITNLSPIISNAFSLGLTGPVDWMEGDRWGIRMSQPLRVVQGSGTLTLPQQRNRAGTIFSQNLPIDLQPLGRQLDLETFYEGSSPYWGKIRISALFRQHPGHQASLPPEGRIGAHYQQTF